MALGQALLMSLFENAVAPRINPAMRKKAAEERWGKFEELLDRNYAAIDERIRQGASPDEITGMKMKMDEGIKRALLDPNSPVRRDFMEVYGSEPEKALQQRTARAFGEEGETYQLPMWPKLPEERAAEAESKTKEIGQSMLATALGGADTSRWTPEQRAATGMPQPAYHYGTGGEIVEIKPGGAYRVLREGKPEKVSDAQQRILENEAYKRVELAVAGEVEGLKEQGEIPGRAAFIPGYTVQGAIVPEALIPRIRQIVEEQGEGKIEVTFERVKESKGLGVLSKNIPLVKINLSIPRRQSSLEKALERTPTLSEGSSFSEQVLGR